MAPKGPIATVLEREIERLRAELARVRAELDGLRSGADKWHELADRLTDERDALRAHLDAVKAACLYRGATDEGIVAHMESVAQSNTVRIRTLEREKGLLRERVDEWQTELANRTQSRICTLEAALRPFLVGARKGAYETHSVTVNAVQRDDALDALGTEPT